MSKKFMHIAMMVCCIFPIVGILFFAPQIKSSLSGTNYPWLFILICPLMHLIMMKFMHKSDKGCVHSQTSKIDDPDKVIDNNQH